MAVLLYIENVDSETDRSHLIMEWTERKVGRLQKKRKSEMQMTKAADRCSGRTLSPEIVLPEIRKCGKLEGRADTYTGG